MKTKLLTFVAVLYTAVTISATDYYFAGAANGWSNNNASYKFTDVNGVLTLEVEDLYGDFKVTEDGGWHPQHGAAAQGEGVALNGSYNLVKCDDSEGEKDAPANCKILIPNEGDWRYKNAKLTLDASNPNALVISLVAGTLYDHSATPVSYYLVGACTNNWNLSDAVEFVDINGVLTATVPDLNGTFKIIKDRAWGTEYASNGAGLVMGEDYALQLGGGNIALANPFGGYTNAVLTLSIDGDNHVLKLVSGTFYVTKNDWFLPGAWQSWKCDDVAKMEPVEGKDNTYELLLAEFSGEFKVVYGQWAVEFGAPRNWTVNTSMELSLSDNNIITPQNPNAIYQDVTIRLVVDYQNVKACLYIRDHQQFSTTVSTSDSQCGVVAGDTSTYYGEQVTIEATPNYGYHFVSWNDGNTDNPRTITVTKDETFTATFAKNVYSITKVANNAQGSISGPSQAEYLDQVTLKAEPNYGYHFVQWSDGNTSNPRTISVTEDMVFTAIFAEDTYFVKIEDLYYNLIVPDKTAEVCGLTGKIRIDDNSIDDWNMLPAQYVAQATCPADAAYTGLKSVKVHADAKFINILVEPNMDDLGDLSYVPFHIFLNTDNSDDTGGCGDLFTDANTDILLEGALFSDNNTCIYAPAVFKWWGEVGGNGWEWVADWNNVSQENCWGAIVCEGQLQGCSSQYVNGKFEIQIDRTYIPATWNTTEFGIGFDIQQNWSAVGVLPCISPTGNNRYGKTAKLQVMIDYTPDAEISGDIVIPETVNYDGVTYSVISIGDGAFYGCTGLTSVTIEAETPPTLGSNAFYNTNNCPIYVPCNAASAYKSAWPGYANRIKYAPLPYKVSTIAENGNVTTTDDTTLTICDPFVTCTATPDYGYHFTQWSDGVKDNPRIFRLTQDTTFTAEFAYDRVGTCGKDLALVWSYDPANKVLTIGNAGEFTENMQFGVEAPSEMEELVIGHNVTSIGNHAFSGIETLKKVTIGESVKTIGEQAFYNCINLETIYNYRATPTNAYSTAFDGVDKFECALYVLPNSIDLYKSASVWRDFYYTYAIGATAATVNEVSVTPTVNTASVAWPAVDNAATYELVIKDKNGNVICTLVFNANGQLTAIAFAAPGRAQASTQATGFSFTVTGLDSGTGYDLTINAKDDQGQVINTTTQSFTTATDITTGIDATTDMISVRKQMINGQLFILRDGKTYTVQGQELK